MNPTPACRPADQGRLCDASTITYTDAGASCSACGAFWPLSRNDGKPVGYLTPPSTRRAAS